MTEETEKKLRDFFAQSEILFLQSDLQEIEDIILTPEIRIAMDNFRNLTKIEGFRIDIVPVATQFQGRGTLLVSEKDWPKKG